ncbi:MAG: hypothetical protein AB8G15_14015 [Saprospiraceae bacterium]
MNSKENKQQVIVLDEKGFLISGNEALCPLSAFQTVSVIAQFPFLGSIFAGLLRQPLWQILEIKKVNTIHTLLPGIYDCSFYRCYLDLYAQEVLIWNIADRTTFYQGLQMEQQIRHERLMRAEQC